MHNPLTPAGKVVMLRALADRLSGGKVVLYDVQQNTVAELQLGAPAFEPINQKGELRAYSIAPEEGANADAVPVLALVSSPEGEPLLRLPVHTSPGEPGIALSQSSVELGGQVRLDALVVRW